MSLARMNERQEARELLDNAVCKYIEMMGIDADTVDYSTLDEWLEGVTGVVNPLEDEDE